MNYCFRRIWLLALTLCLCLCTNAQDAALLNTGFIPAARKGTIQHYFDEIAQKTGITLSYSASALNLRKKVRLQGNEQTIGDVLQTILQGCGVHTAAGMDRKILIIPDHSTGNRSTSYTINGYIKDDVTKEVLIGANIIIPSVGTGAVSNNYGFYSITLPAGKYIAYVTYIGYRPDTLLLEATQDLRKDVALTSANTLRELKIVADKKNPVPAEHLHLTAADLYDMPTLLGETDVMRSLQALSGVQSGIDGSSSLQVRGGDPGQNLNLLDGVPLYYVDHFFGVTSVFNTDAVKSVDFYKGAFPARYGGRLSSIIDVHTKDGDMERLGGQFTMGLVKSSLTLEGPLIKDKSSIMVSARRTWIDGLIVPITNQVGIYFYDINAKANYIINKNNRVYLSFYTGRDQIRYSEDDAYLRGRWGNTIGSAKWNAVLNPKLFMNTILTYSQFKYELKDKNQVIDSGALSTLGNYVGISSIQDVSAQVQFQWTPGYRHHIETGGNFSHTYFVPTALESTDDQISFPVKPQDNKMQSNEVTLYAEDEIKLGSRWTLRPGLHWSFWFSGDFNYSSLQPRIYASCRVGKNGIFYTSFSHMAQFLHLINNNSYGLPTDFWVPSTRTIKPEKALLATIGYSGSKKGYKYSLEAYYKDINGTIVYTTGKTLFDNSARWQDKIEQGRGWSYGAELSAEKKWGPVSASLAYTLSWNWRQFEHINNGNPFPYRYDRRHNLKIMLSYKPSKSIKINANWLFMSGEAFTLPDQVYPDFDNNLLISPGRNTTTSYTYHYSNWNAYRLPPIHRLDLGVNFIKHKKQNMTRTWSLGIFNVYGRPNVMFVQLNNDISNGTLKLEGVSMLQFIPYISYKLSF